MFIPGPKTTKKSEKNETKGLLRLVGPEMCSKWTENDRFRALQGSGRSGAGNVAEIDRKRPFSITLGLRAAWGSKCGRDGPKTTVFDHCWFPAGLGPEMWPKWTESDRFRAFWGSGRSGAANVAEMTRKLLFSSTWGFRAASQ